MLIIDDKLVSPELLDVHFVCDLDRCKGACCVEGDLGAPLDEDELAILEAIYPKVKPYLPEAGQKAIDIQGHYISHPDGTFTTPLVRGKECAYTVFNDGLAKCGIELAHKDGQVDWLKPISCHLYPIRLKTDPDMEMESIQYDHWHICKAACKLGNKLGVPLYKFLEAPLTRKYGAEFYAKMSEVLEAFDAAQRG